MKRLSFFKVYGVEDPKLAERRMRALPNDTRYWSPANSQMFMAMRQCLDTLERCLIAGVDVGVETQVIDGVYQKPEKPELQPYQRAILENQPVIRWSNRRQRWPTANVVTAQFDDEVIVTCRNCGGSPRKGLMHGLCFRCSGMKAINHEI